ncbi:hypothetical protein GCM10010377_73300 [Streptomyces viridiviolaceus]|nr:hypothetical protein GCM10010377_73300 [Streptomyces viridiviolaceus]
MVWHTSGPAVRVDRGKDGPLRQFTIANSHHPNHTVQTRALHAYLRWRNANARHRDVLAAERKERPHPQRERHPLGRTSPQDRSVSALPTQCAAPRERLGA